MLYEAYEPQIDMSYHEQITIGIGGTCTVRLENGTVYDLVESMVNYHTRTIAGKDLKEINYGFKTHQVKSTIIPLEEISEVIFEGFYITNENRDNILKLIKEVKFTKIPARK